uniref:(d)CMP kinase n=1 Tax=Paulinella micropora TaxID=1928728 RepID=A0A385I102_9EUKA|nr:putative bifunctional enzyme [Paulinella micropora]AXY63545.1 putative bifunctional enzyme [Paulinella micropora]
MPRKPIIAIDGPAGAGKSTVTRAFAKHLGLIYLDTGAMYRALTWWIHYKGIDSNDEDLIKPLLNNLDLRLFLEDDYKQQVWINGHTVTEVIRSPQITADVSLVATHRSVRDALTLQQKKVGRQGGLVAEGRDIGTAVFPYADLKIFLTATSRERAHRRANDLRAQGFDDCDLYELEKQIIERDNIDYSRAIAPLRQSSDAIVIITDKLSCQQVVQVLVNVFQDQFL